MKNDIFFYIAAAADNFARAAEIAPQLLDEDYMRGILSAVFNIQGAAQEAVMSEQVKAELEGRVVDEKKQHKLIVASAALDFVRERFAAVENLQWRK